MTSDRELRGTIQRAIEQSDVLMAELDRARVLVRQAAEELRRICAEMKTTV